MLQITSTPPVTKARELMLAAHPKLDPQQDPVMHPTLHVYFDAISAALANRELTPKGVVAIVRYEVAKIMCLNNDDKALTLLTAYVPAWMNALLWEDGVIRDEVVKQLTDQVTPMPQLATTITSGVFNFVNRLAELAEIKGDKLKTGTLDLLKLFLPGALAEAKAACREVHDYRMQADIEKQFHMDEL